jgi:hypothetical protein
MSTTLEIELSESTLKKLRAYTLLSGRPASEVSASLAEFVDQYLSTSLATMLDLGNVPVTQSAPASKKTLYYPPGARAAKAAPPQEEREFIQEGGLDQFSHGLSGDTDDGENLSLAEQAEKIPTRQPKKQRPPEPVADETGGDEDDGTEDFGTGDEFGEFLESVESKQQQPAPAEARAVGVSRAFNPAKRRGRISNFTGNE